MVAPNLASTANDLTILCPNFAKPTLRVADHDIAESTDRETAKLTAPLSDVLTSELDWAERHLGLPSDEILLAALGRTIARTIGDGVVAVDVARDGWYPTIYPVSLSCATVQQASATRMLGDVHQSLEAAADALHPAAEARSEIYFNYIGKVPETPSGEGLRGHALELRIYRTGGLLHLDWWYDARRFYPSTMEELTEQFPLALIELASESVPAA
jgi:hypothetical protein